MAPSSSTLASVGIGIPVAVIVVWLLNTYSGVAVPGEVQSAFGAVISAFVGYFFKGGQASDQP